MGEHEARITASYKSAYRANLILDVGGVVFFASFFCLTALVQAWPAATINFTGVCICIWQRDKWKKKDARWQQAIKVARELDVDIRSHTETGKLLIETKKLLAELKRMKNDS